jgi:hypothetical protein
LIPFSPPNPRPENHPMIRCKLCFAAEGVTTDAETRQVSAFGLLEDVQAPRFPVTLPRIVLLVMWERAVSDAPEWSAELVMALNGREIIRQVVDINFMQVLRTRSTVRVEGASVSEPGRLVLRLGIPGHDTAEWAINVDFAAQAGAGSAAVPASRPIYESQPVSMVVGPANPHR